MNNLSKLDICNNYISRAWHLLFRLFDYFLHSWALMFCVALLIPFGARLSAQSVRLSNQISGIPVGLAMEYLEDSSKSLTFAHVRVATAWKRSSQAVPVFGFTRSTYWLRFSIQNPSPEINDWLLDIAYPPLDRVGMYVVEPGGSERLLMFGDYYPFSERMFQHSHYVVKLSHPDTAKREYYLKIDTESSMQIPARIFRAQDFIERTARSEMLYGCLYGTLLVLIVYNFFLFLSLRLWSYLLYVLYISCVLLYFLCINGHAAQYLTGELMWWTNKLTAWSPNAFCAALLLFCRSFLQMNRYAPIFDRVLLTFAIVSGMASLSAFVAPYYIPVHIATVMIFPIAILCCIGVFIVARRGNQSAWYFFIAVAVFLTGSLLFALRNRGVVASTVITDHAIELGSALEGVLLSFALAHRYRILRMEKEQAQREALRIQEEATGQLEEKVRQRTLELEESNKKIQNHLQILDEQSGEISLANTQLQEKNELLENLNREKDEFLGIAAHDLKNPLASISMSASILDQYYNQMTPEQIHERLNNIMLISDRMMTIISNLLDLNAIETGTFNLSLQRLEIHTILEEVAKEYHERITAKSMHIQLSLYSESLMIEADNTALREIMDNLMSNAVKYASPGTTITLRSLRRNGSVRIEVQDEGPGFTPEDRQKLFGRFARLSARPTGGEQSTGLGLSIVKKLTEVMGGRVCCESNPGEGATFIVEFPLSAS